MKNLKGKRVLIFQQRGWSKRVGHPLAARLQKEGCTLAALTFKKGIHNFTKKQKEVKYDLIISNDEVVEDPKKYLGNSSITITEVCKGLGVETIWPIAASMRNHVKSYGGRYYYSYRQNVSDEEIVNYILAVYKYINIFFKEFDPQVIITPNFTEAPHLMFDLFAKRRGVKIIALTDCKISGLWTFTHSYLHKDGPFNKRVEVLNKNKINSENSERAKKYIKEFREHFKSPDYTEKIKKPTLLKRLREELAPYRAIYKWYTRKQTNELKNLGIMKDYRPPKIILRDHYKAKKYRKFAENYSYYPIKKIEKFIYFPLQFQPEEAIDVMAVYFSNQIETARLVAMALPDDYTLVVKEHPAMLGYRAPSYLEKIAKTPNIKLIDHRISSETVLKKADLIISPNSTTVAEAAFYNKPAIQLGDLGTTLLLPNVTKHTDITNLTHVIKEVLKKDLHSTEYEKKLENYVAAAFDTGIQMNYFGLWQKADEMNNVSMDKLLNFYIDEIIEVIS